MAKAKGNKVKRLTSKELAILWDLFFVSRSLNAFWIYDSRMLDGWEEKSRRLHQPIPRENAAEAYRLRMYGLENMNWASVDALHAAFVILCDAFGVKRQDLSQESSIHGKIIGYVREASGPDYKAWRKVLPQRWRRLVESDDEEGRRSDDSSSRNSNSRKRGTGKDRTKGTRAGNN